MKKYLLWIIALCMVLLGAVLAGCHSNTDSGEPVTEPKVKIYWNIDRDDYPLTEEGLTTRLDAGGVYRARFAVDGEQVDLFFNDGYLMADADSFDFVGMVVDENNYVTEVIPVEYCSGGVAVLNYTVESFDGQTIVCNAVSNFRGQRIKLSVNENTKVYNVGGEGLLVGLPGTIEVGQQIHAVMGYDGYLSHVFVEPPFEQKPVYWNVNRQYDSASKLSKRDSDALGVYTILFAVDGKQVELKTRDADVVNSIDSFAAKCMSLEFDEEGYIKSASHPRNATGGGSTASWFHVMELTENGFRAEKFSGSDKGSKKNLQFAREYKVYNVSSRAEMVGEVTELQLYDQVHCLTDENGDVCVVFVITRFADLPIYWNIDRCYDSASKSTTRRCDSDGWYYLKMANDGSQVTLKTQDKAIVDYIDSRAAKACALELDGDVITAAYAPTVTYGGQTFASWMSVTEIGDDGTVYAKKSDGSTDEALMFDGTKVYNVSENARYVGCPTDLREGDLIHGLKGIDGKIYTIFVVDRAVYSPIYWNVERMYSSKTKETTRTPDAEGYYHITFAVNGEQVTYKTNDKELVTEIDSIATRVMGLSVYNGVISKVHAAKSVNGYTGGSKAGWCDIISIDGTTVTVKKNMPNDDDYGQVYTLTIPTNCPVYNGSDNVEDFVGEATTLKVGDRIHSLVNADGKIVLVYVVERPLDWEIYWNINKYDLDSDGHTTRPQDSDGGYSFLLSAAGTQMTYKTYDQEIADLIDSRAARCTAMKVKDGVITDAIRPTQVLKGMGGSFASWMKVTSIDEDGTVHALKSDGTSDSGMPIGNCEIYDVSGVSGFEGIPTELKEGDQIHGLRNSEGQVTLIYVISRDVTAYCEACGQEVLWNKFDGNTSGHCYLAEDVKDVEKIEIPADQTLCLNLNGHNLDGKSNILRIFDIFGTLNLMGEGTVTAHNASTKMAPCFYVKEGGTFNLYGGELTSEFSSPRGGVGIVQYNFTMYGGRIYGGEATTGDGGNVEFIGGGGTVKLLGGVIEGGKAAGRGGGFYAHGNLIIGGDIQITGNEGSNLYLRAGKKITVLDDFTGSVGLTMPEAGVFSGAAAEGMEKRFTSDEGYNVIRNSDGTLSLVAPPHEHCVCDGTGNHGTCVSVTWEPWTGTVEDGGHYYLTEDLKDIDRITIEANTTVSICLNGHNIDGKSSTLRIFNIFGTLNLCGEGTVTAHNASTKMAPVFYVQTGGTFNLFGGELTSEFSSPRGAVGLVQATMNMYGGKIYGGHATGNGGNIDLLVEGFLNLYGGTIEGGKADGYGNGVYALGTITIGGDMQITDGLCIGNSKLLTVKDDFTGSIVISLKNGNGVFTNAVKAGIESCFKAVSGKNVIRNADGKLGVTDE